MSPATFAREFRQLLSPGGRLHAVGRAKEKPTRILRMGCAPEHRLDLFGTRIDLSNVRFFHKDLSLVWRVLGYVLRKGSADRIAPYDDFIRPRARAAADRRNLINGAKSIARFERAGDPKAFRFVRGFEPDFK